jgi:RNA polymerase sigma factor (sigma-70 family)
MDDTQLLQQYVKAGCERAFAELVSRHIDLVYGAARRVTRDAHMAEDVTQAVFIVLAKKASRVRHGAMLPAWLLSATRYLSMNAIAQSNRRRKHEMAAGMNSSNADAQGPAVVDDVASDAGMSPLLDAALAKLAAADRSAVAMRYLQGRSMREIAVSMGISQVAAQKRVQRALIRLRDYFARRGVVLDGNELDAGLARQMGCNAPSALAAAVAAKALWAKSIGAGAGASGSAGVLADVVLRSIGWMTTAKIAAGCGIVIAVLCAAAVAVQSAAHQTQSGAGGVAGATTAPLVRATTQLAPAMPFSPVMFSAESIWQPYVPSTQPGTDIVPISNDSLVPDRHDKADVSSTGLDPDIRRGKAPSVKVSVNASDAGASVYRKFDPAPYIGKRIRVSGFFKSQDVERQSGLNVIVYRADGAMLAQDDLGGRWVNGTMDWTRHDIVCDVSPQAASIIVEVFLRGPGTVWADGLELAVVDRSVPVNDDHRWRGWTQTPAKFQTALDRNELHNGRPTIRMTGLKTNHPVNDWIAYDHTEPDVRPFLGRKVRLSVMIKSDAVSWAGPVIRAVGVQNSTVQRDEFWGRRPVRGTNDWTRYATTLDCPKDAVDLSFGVWMNGRGKVWFDDLRFEVVK